MAQKQDDTIRPGLLVVVIGSRYISSEHPEVIGCLFTIREGPYQHPQFPNRIVWVMEENFKFERGYHWCFARDEIKPLPPLDDELKRIAEHATSY